MARPLRIELPGAVYHVTSRGDGGEPIVLGDEDREDLLGVLGQALHRFGACEGNGGNGGNGGNEGNEGNGGNGGKSCISPPGMLFN